MTSQSPPHDDLDEWLAGQPPKVRRLIEAARRAIRSAVPGVEERLRPGWGLLGYNAPAYFAFIAPGADHLRIGFERGVELLDPDGLLEGTGRQVRYHSVASPGALRGSALAALLREAASLPPRGRNKRAL